MVFLVSLLVICAMLHKPRKCLLPFMCVWFSCHFVGNSCHVIHPKTPKNANYRCCLCGFSGLFVVNLCHVYAIRNCNRSVRSGDSARMMLPMKKLLSSRQAAKCRPSLQTFVSEQLLISHHRVATLRLNPMATWWKIQRQRQTR